MALDCNLHLCVSHMAEANNIMDLSMISVRDPDRTRITKTEVVSLKAKTSEIDSPKFSPRRIFVTFIKSVRDILTILIPTRNTYRCKRSGHVLSKRGWRFGQLPQCGDCGKEIRDPLELRRSS